jgi:hypothetical protein
MLPASIVLLGLPLAFSGVAAQGVCTPPVMPPPLNGAEASAEQLRAAIADARAFIGQANIYENCLKDEIEASHASAAANGTPVDPATDQQVESQIAINHRLKDKVSSDAAAAMDAYKKAHTD